MAKIKNIEARNSKICQYIGLGLSLPVFSSRLEDLLRFVTQILNKKAYTKPCFMVTLNPEILVLAMENMEYLRAIRRANLVIADGNGLRLLGLNTIIPGRVLVKHLLDIGKYRTYFLGGKAGVAVEMARRFGGMGDEGLTDAQSQIWDLKLNRDIIKRINKFGPDLLLVAYGAPWQELWIANNLPKLKAKVIIGVGGTFDYLTGKSKLPPVWAERLKLEWLWRLVREPWRVKRQTRLIKYVLKVLSSKL